MVGCENKTVISFLLILLVCSFGGNYIRIFCRARVLRMLHFPNKPLIRCTRLQVYLHIIVRMLLYAIQQLVMRGGSLIRVSPLPTANYHHTRDD